MSGHIMNDYLQHSSGMSFSEIVVFLDFLLILQKLLITGSNALHIKIAVPVDIATLILVTMSLVFIFYSSLFFIFQKILDFC
jgi:hypothetical protein